MRSFDHLVLAVDDLDEAVDFYQGMGFTLTPLAHHPFGTSNRLVQMGSTFLELLSVTRPELIPETNPGDFNFPAFHRDYLKTGSGFSMLAMTSQDFRADRKEFSQKDVTLYNPFEFSRLARQPDGRDVTVGFKLTFVADPDLPGVPVFTCHHQHAPEFFWKADYQRHLNGARDVVSISIDSDDGERAEKFISRLDLDKAKAGVDVLPEKQGGTRFGGFTVMVDDMEHIAAILQNNAVTFRQAPDALALPSVFGARIEFVKPGTAST